MTNGTIALLSQDAALTRAIKQNLDEQYNVVSFSSVPSVLDYIYNSLPNLVIIDITKDHAYALPVLNNLKEDPIFNKLPILAVMEDSFFSLPRWDTLPVEDYVRRSYIKKDLVARSSLNIFRAERIVEVNPLTRLPGNISINRQIQGRIDKGDIFALCYADLDQFKPFNDYYGFSRGDDVIKMTGRIILNTVKNRQPEDSFVGHIGGDDFIYIVSVDLAETVAREIIESFETIVPIFYDNEEQKKGFIESKDRQGNAKTFSLITLSIGITTSNIRSFSHYGQMTEAVSEMKQFAKRSDGNSYRIDRRQG